MSCRCCNSAGPTLDGTDAYCGPSAHRREERAVMPPWWRDRTLALPALSGLFCAAGLIFAWTGFEVSALVAFVLGLVAGGWTFVPETLRKLFTASGRARLGVGLLMTIAAIGAVLLGHVGEAAMLAFLFSLAEKLEDRAMDRAKEGLRSLLTLVPPTARVSRMGRIVTVPVSDLCKHDTLVIGAGERVATDSIVVTGCSSIDTSAVTGESIPIEVGPGDLVPAGTVNGKGSLLVEATADGGDNSLTQIVALVEQAHARKGERARLADRIARPLVPAVLVAAMLVAVFGVLVGDASTWIERALVVLVAASPCAMAIAVPVTVISAIGAASKLGVVIKSGAAFERLGTIGSVAFDKTGTLTMGCPQVIDVRVPAGYEPGQVLAWAAALETRSTHPLATAITAAVPDTLLAEQVNEDAGHGLTGRVDGKEITVGSPRWLNPADLRADAQSMAEAGMTVVVVAVDGEVAGLIGVRDELRPEAAETIRLLRNQGINTVMLTGDGIHTARALASEAGISDVHAEQLPSDKATAITRLAAERPTAMVGDGINDAPALATATVGIAMGTTGSAAAVESADIAFTGRDLRLIPAALAHAKRGRRIMVANIALALAIIVVLFPLALFGVLGLAGVVLVHEVAEVIVILNGVRAAHPPRGFAPAW